MQKLVRLPLLFFFLAACIGLLLRWHFIDPQSWLKFPYWLHAHSHLMFLGWVFNVLYLAFVHHHIEVGHQKKYKTLFLFIQVLLLGMLSSFPLQGYGVVSIVLSTLHTVAIGIFSFWFLKDSCNQPFEAARWFAKIALFFFLISAAGPLALGPIMANGLGHSKWYFFAVYYYLHFQYNGVFTFGVLSLLFSLLKDKGVILEPVIVKWFGYLMLFSCFLTYSLSTLWANPGWTVNSIGFVSALIQFAAVIIFIRISWRDINRSFVYSSTTIKSILGVALLSFLLKLILQIASAYPSIAQLAYENRPIVIAYLHLVLLGMVSSFLLAWYIEMRWIRKPSNISMVLLFTGFVGMESVLISGYSGADRFFNSPVLLFLFSAFITIGVGALVYSSWRSR